MNNSLLPVNERRKQSSLRLQATLHQTIASGLRLGQTYRTIGEFTGFQSSTISRYINQSPDLKRLAQARSSRSGGPRKKGVSKYATSNKSS